MHRDPVPISEIHALVGIIFEPLGTGLPCPDPLRSACESDFCLVFDHPSDFDTGNIHSSPE